MTMTTRRHCLWLANMAQRGDNCCLRRVVATLLLINKTNERIKIMLHPQSSRGSNSSSHKEPTEADQKRRTRNPKWSGGLMNCNAGNRASVQRATCRIRNQNAPLVPHLNSVLSSLLSRCGDVTMTVVVRHVWCMLQVPRTALCSAPPCGTLFVL